MTETANARPTKASDLLALAQQRRAESAESIRRWKGEDDDWMYETDRLPDWAREDDDVEPLDYRVDIGPYISLIDPGGEGWRILRDGNVVGYACEGEGGRFIEWSLEAPEPNDLRSYDPLGLGFDDDDLNEGADE